MSPTRSEAAAQERRGMASLEDILAGWAHELRARRGAADAGDGEAAGVQAPERQAIEWPAEWGLEHFEIRTARRKPVHGSIVVAELAAREPWASCRECSDGWRPVKVPVEGMAVAYDAIIPCGCQHMRAIVDAFNAAELPAKAATDGWLRDGRFDFARAERAGSTAIARTPGGEAQQRTIRGIVGDVIARLSGPAEGPRRGLLIGGGTGTGKTHVAAAIAWQLLRRGVRVRFVEWLDYLARVQATFDDDDARAADVREPFKTASLLIIDDLGRGSGGGWGKDEFARLIAPRLEDPACVTLFTTNYWPDGIPVPAGVQVDLLSRRIGQRSMSRLAEACDLAVLAGEDQRTRHLGGGR